MSDNSIDRDLLVKFISGKATVQERVTVLDWIELSESNSRVFSEMKNLWVLEGIKNIEKEDYAHNIKRGFLRKVIGYAAAIALLVTSITAGVYLYNEKNAIAVAQQQPVTFKYVVNTGVKGVVDLPDGSKVWLNSSSYIICPQKFSDEAREIEIEGEGYFEVVSNKNWPMLIKTSKKHTVKVTGTTFNLSSYSNDNKLIVTLISGEISLINDNKKSEIKLSPKQEIVIVDEKETQLLKNPNINNKTAWKEGLLLFDNTAMVDVVKRMERWYGVNFKIKDSLIYDYRFTAKFRSESITQVLEILRLSSNIKYKIDSTTITLAKR
ncbi:MAG: hypothetical protein CVU13_00345 [Bacteroidetes bacterium HGW-Bacteroidetes-8]|jgi:ferric-dicitrate binding protein FerR (iron transport regulator)|nr:MAG: hypothetical protein CVU13_00345 [Bacteroidetes bacterium HGW-Bacteroidetes-8]